MTDDVTASEIADFVRASGEYMDGHGKADGVLSNEQGNVCMHGALQTVAHNREIMSSLTEARHITQVYNRAVNATRTYMKKFHPEAPWIADFNDTHPEAVVVKEFDKIAQWVEFGIEP